MLATIHSAGTVYASKTGTDEQSCAFAGVAILSSGRWMCGFRAGPGKGLSRGQHALVMVSDDEGATWRLTGRFAEAPTRNGKRARFRAVYPTALAGNRALVTLYWVDDTDPDMPLFNEATNGLLETRAYFALSEDGGETWSEPRPVENPAFDCPFAITGPILALPDGRWGCQFETYKTYDDPSPWMQAAMLMFSADEGRAWPEFVATAEDPDHSVYYWDQRPSVLSDGRLLNMFWTFDTAANAYLPIHSSVSYDNGRTWTAPISTGIMVQPAPPVLLPDGRIALVYVDRTGAPAIRLRLSADGGQTWPEDTTVTLASAEGPRQVEEKGTMQDAIVEMTAYSLGLPSSALLTDGDVLVVYYTGPHADQTDIRWVRVSIGQLV